MGISNGKAHLERRISGYLSDLIDKRKEFKAAMQALADLPAINERITHLEKLVSAVELLLREDDLTWNCSRVKPQKKHTFQSPFLIGEAGPMALDLLRKATSPMTARGISRVMLDVLPETPPFLARAASTASAIVSSF